MPILDLPTARAALSMRDENTERDALLVDHLAAVDSVVEHYIGDWVVRRTVTIPVPADGILPGASVVSIVSGQYRNDASAVDVSGMFVAPGGILASSTSLPVRPWLLTLEVGMDPVPAAIKRGAAEILTQAWATQRSEDVPGFLVPYRAAAWLDPYVLVSIA